MFSVLEAARQIMYVTTLCFHSLWCWGISSSAQITLYKLYHMSPAGFASNNSFVSSLEDAGRQYGCPGEVVNYTCTIVDTTGGLTTFWRGTAFSCSATSNVIPLTHALFNSGISGMCTNGAITAASVGVVDNCYTSRLMVTVSPALNETTVECTLSLSGMGIGNSTLLVAGM